MKITRAWPSTFNDIDRMGGAEHLVFARPIGQFAPNLADDLSVQIVALANLFPHHSDGFVGRQNPNGKPLGEQRFSWMTKKIKSARLRLVLRRWSQATPVKHGLRSSNGRIALRGDICAKS